METCFARQILLFRCSVTFSFLTAHKAFQAQAFQAEELAVDGLSQLSDELEEETAFLFAARGVAFVFFAGFFFLAPFFFGTGQRSDACFREPGISKSCFGFLQDAVPVLCQVLRKAFWAVGKDQAQDAKMLKHRQKLRHISCCRCSG